MSLRGPRRVVLRLGYINIETSIDNGGLDIICRESLKVMDRDRLKYD
jgi:hypothetical protein